MSRNKLFEGYTKYGFQINTAYQIGGGVTLAICSAVVQAVDIDKGHDVAQQYTTGLWCTAGIAGIGLLVAVFGLKNDFSASSQESDSASSQTEDLTGGNLFHV